MPITLNELSMLKNSLKKYMSAKLIEGILRVQDNANPAYSKGK